jgi:hypothetical protein
MISRPVLMEDPVTRVVLAAMCAGRSLPEPAANGLVTAYSVSGQTLLHEGDECCDLGQIPRERRRIVNWDLRESMNEADIEVILERAKELHPEARPRMISDNGPQFIAKDFKEFIRVSGMTHVRTSPYYPQSNGKIERWHKSLKGECIWPGNAAVAGGCAASGGGLRGTLQRFPLEQCHWLHHAEGHARRPSAGDPC